MLCEGCPCNPCDSRCPDAPEPVEVYTCAYCGEPIVEGEDFVELDGEFYHEDCFMDKAASILLEKFGAVKGVAEAAWAR